MEENGLDSTTRHWLSVHKSVRTNIRRLTALLALLALFSAVQGFGHNTNVNEDYQLAREFTLKLWAEGRRDEVTEHYLKICKNDNPACEFGTTSVRLESIPEIGWELGRFLKQKHPSDSYRFQGFEFGIVAYSLLLIFAPVGLLGMIWFSLNTSAKIAAMLRGAARKKDQIQQSINSIFSERATENIGDRRWPYAVVWTLTLTILGIVPAFFYTFETSLVLNTEVTISETGYIFPLPEAPRDERTDVMVSDEVLYLVIPEILSVFILAGAICRTVLKQLSPRDAPG